MGLIPSNFKSEVKAVFKEIKAEVSKPILVYSNPDTYDCPNCLSDHTGISTGIFDTSFVAPVEIFGREISPLTFSRIKCPVCNGKGILENENTTLISGIIRWNPPSEQERGDMVNTSGGLEGKNVVRLKTDKCHYDLLKDCNYIMVDNVKCILHLPPVIRHIGGVDVLVTAYFISTEVGHTVREG